jgi:hypothetical protein
LLYFSSPRRTPVARGTRPVRDIALAPRHRA